MDDKNGVLSIVGEHSHYSARICDLIKQVVSSYYGLPVTAFDSRSRVRNVIKMKQATVYFIRATLPKVSLQFIGDQVGGYDHSTVLHCLKTTKNLMETDKETKKEIDDLDSKLQIEKDSVRLDGDIEKEYYYINMNECISLKLPNNRAIVMTGFTLKEVVDFVEANNLNYDLSQPRVVPMEHTSTKLFILQKKTDGGDKK